MDGKTTALTVTCAVLAFLLALSLASSTLNKLNETTNNDQFSELQDIVNLAKTTMIADSQTINQQANQYSTSTFQADYAGYVYVRIDSSTTDKNYVEVTYTSSGGLSPHSINYDQKTIINNTGEWACFPVLPSTVEVRIGNTNLLEGATETVTIAYYY